MTRVTFILALLLGWLVEWWTRRRTDVLDQDDCDDYNDTEGRPPEDG